MANDGDRGAISLARSLIGRVASTVLAVLPGTGERRSDRPPPLSGAVVVPMAAYEVPRPESPAGPEPAVPARGEQEQVPAGARARLADPEFEGVSAIEGEKLAIVWRASEDAIARARLLAAAGAEMVLRTVRVSWPEGAEGPVVTTEDHGSVPSEGAVELGARRAGEKMVVALGLGGADRGFVAIEHATLG